jgi:hypothetical protein
LAICSSSFAGIVIAASDNNQEAAAARQKLDAAHAAPHSPFSTATCSFTSTSGAKDTFLKYCVTENGNITLLETPLGHNQLEPEVAGEGYPGPSPK